MNLYDDLQEFFNDLENVISNGVDEIELQKMESFEELQRYVKDKSTPSRDNELFEMEESEEELPPHIQDIMKEFKINNCEHEWKVTYGLYERYYDCKLCNVKKEDLK